MKGIRKMNQKELLWKVDLEDGTYQNPILFADYSDPDVIRVGDTYYMTASSFHYMPGLPILISKDLIHWKLVNYAIEHIPYEDYNQPAHAKGIWAPSIRYHNGEFFIFVGMPDEGIFMLKTKDPLGKWSKPVLVREAKGFIDPCPLWDEDGTAYIVHAYAKSRIGFNSMLGIFPISPDGTSCIGEDKIVYDGSITQPTIEGPKIYKRNGWYYIFAPAGGVRTGWQTVLRSKNIWGPYEEKIVMTQGDTAINGPHQGGLVDTPFHEEWFLHFQDMGVYGRIVHLQPVTWLDNEWPVIGVDRKGNGCGEPQIRYRKPRTSHNDPSPSYLEVSDDFKSPTLGLQWQWNGNYKESFYSLEEREHALRLYSRKTCNLDPVTLWNSTNILTQKIICPSFKAIITMDYDGLEEQEQAGIIMLGGDYVSAAICKKAGRFFLRYLEAENNNEVMHENILYEEELTQNVHTIELQLTFHEDTSCTISYRLEGEKTIPLPFISKPKDHTWVGAKFGVYSIAYESKKEDGYADFLWVKVE